MPLADGRATHRELGRQVRLSADTVADCVRRLQASESSARSGPG
ncbi:AsnC family transcriptional regulator [Streptomyces sp. MMG1121]